MADPLRFEPFDKARHDREHFDCGVPALDEYLKTKLGQHGKRGLTRGYVLASHDGKLAGYFTLAASRITVSVIPDGHGFPAKMPLPTTLMLTITLIVTLALTLIPSLATHFRTFTRCSCSCSQSRSPSRSRSR